MLTKNHKRSAEQAGDANPRADNHHGHILELSPPTLEPGGVDHAATSGSWDILLLGGDPNNPKHRARYHPGTSPDGYLANPDNCTFDNQGRLWVSTDGAEGTLNTCDGIWVCETEGDQRALTRRFLRVPIGAELCSPQFTPDNKTLFVSVQHPGSSKGSSFDHPSTRWPDFDEQLPPRASVVAIRHHNGDVVGRG
jgi:secreted PhoX family phosphatase